MEDESFIKKSERELEETVKRARREDERARKLHQKMLKMRQESIDNAD